MLLRKIEKHDVYQVSSLASYVWCNTYCKEGVREIEARYVINHFSLNKFKELLNNPTKSCIVAVDGAKIQGICLIDLRSKFKNLSEFGDEITNLYVHPDLQMKGIGKQLIQSVFHHFGPNKWLTTWVHNHQAIAFYKRNNFNIIGNAVFNLFGEIHQNMVFHHNIK